MTKPIDVYVAYQHPFYQVMVDGKVYDTFTAYQGYRLTTSQLIDVANGYREWFDGEPDD